MTAKSKVNKNNDRKTKKLMEQGFSFKAACRKLGIKNIINAKKTI